MGTKAVSLRPSRPTANVIWGTVQLPKLLIPPEPSARAAVHVTVVVEGVHVSEVRCDTELGVEEVGLFINEVSAC